MERVECVALVEDLCGSSVDVLWVRVVQRARAETDDVPFAITDREHQPASEEVVRSPVVCLPDQTGGHGRFTGDSKRLEVLNKAIP